MTNNNNITALKNLTLSSSLFCPDSQETPMASYLSPHLISLSRRNLASKSLSFRLKSEIETFHNYENNPMDCRFYWSNNFRDWRWEVWRNLKPSGFFFFFFFSRPRKKKWRKRWCCLTEKFRWHWFCPQNFQTHTIRAIEFYLPG